MLSYNARTTQSPKAALLLVHGLGSNASWWDDAADFFLHSGMSSYAVDLRHNTSFAEFFASVREIAGLIRKENPDRKLFAVGESLGSLIILLLALKDKLLFDGVVCISPAFSSRLRLNIPGYIGVFLTALYDPKRRHPLPVTADMCTRDPAKLKMIEATYDKDVMQTSSVLTAIFFYQLALRISRLKVPVPALFLGAGDDKLVFTDATKKVFARMAAPDKKLIEYPGMYHSLSIDTGRDKVFADIAAWVAERA
jgi:alpha-beta hydrolase superfamily lysophospholipase